MDTDRPPAAIPLSVAAVAWVASWFAGNLLASVALTAAGATGTDVPTWARAIGALSLWIPMVSALFVVSQRHATGRVRDDLGFRFAAADALGIVFGVATQLIVVRAVYWPLQQIWPDTFAQERLEETARRLVDRAESDGAVWMAALVVIVVVGAPVVEELVYRGLLQGAAWRRVGASRPGRIAAVVGVAAWFAAIHLRPVEFVGLFVVGLVLGACVVWTGRLGVAVVAHAAFNATGLAVVALG